MFHYTSLPSPRTPTAMLDLLSGSSDPHAHRSKNKFGHSVGPTDRSIHISEIKSLVDRREEGRQNKQFTTNIIDIRTSEHTLYSAGRLSEPGASAFFVNVPAPVKLIHINLNIESSWVIHPPWRTNIAVYALTHGLLDWRPC